MSKKNLPVVSLIFFILAGLFLVFAIFAARFSFNYISELVAMGQVVVSDSLFEVVSFHMGNFGQYIVYTALLFGVGWIVYLFSGVEVETYEYEEEDFETAEMLSEEPSAE
ncbi:MAG: hypothetical protein ACNA70_02075 [Brevefilum sp.]